jgi:hypothetical protein
MAGLLTCKICELLWHGPLGPVTLIVTDTRTFFNRHAVIDIAIPPGTPFPLETLSYIATAQEIDRARGARGFVQSLIAAAENTAAWREYVARPTKRSSHARQQAPPSRPKPGRRRLKLGAPR